MKILICGSRDLSTKEKQTMERLLIIMFQSLYKTEAEKQQITILNGYARGADMVAYEMAKQFGIKVEVYKPDYERYGNSLAPLIRDDLMVNLASKVFCYWNGQSEGTLHVRDYARKKGKPVKVYNISEKQNSVYPHG